MDIELGSFNVMPAIQHKEMLADVVSGALLNLKNRDQIGVVEIDSNLSDTASFCEHYQIKVNQAVNCVILEAKNGEENYFAACVVLADTRADINGLSRSVLNAKKISFAKMEEAVSRTKMEYGAITPIGLPEGWPILVDKAVVDSGYVVMGSGVRKSKLVLLGSILASLPGVQILEGLGKVKSL